MRATRPPQRVALVRIARRLTMLVVLFAAGALLAGALTVGAQEVTTTETETATVTETATTTQPATTETVTTTVEQTTTKEVTTSLTATGTTEKSASTTPAWVWVLLGIAAVAAIVLGVLLATRGGGGGMPLEQRRRRLDAAVGTWVAQGWALESQTGDSAVLQRAGDTMLLTVDATGQVSTRQLT